MSNKHYVKRLKRLARKAGLGRHGSNQLMINDIAAAKKAVARRHAAEQRAAHRASTPAVNLLHKMEEQDRQRAARVRKGMKSQGGE